jgi:amino acid permease
MIPSQIQEWARRSSGFESNEMLNVALVVCFILIPLCSLKKIQFLGYTSFIAFISIFFIVFVILFRFTERLIVTGIPVKDIAWVNPNLIRVLGTIPV